MNSTHDRTYVVGLPVVITIHPDGSVLAEVDLSEAYDIYDGAPLDDDLMPLYDDETINVDVLTVSAAVAAGQVVVR